MNKNIRMAIAYAQNALSFIFLDSGISNSLRAIYLYGSAVRDDLEEESDIDIFIDCDEKKEKEIEGIAKAALSKFYKSKDFEKWKLFNFNYPISFQIGNLSVWKLKTSIMAEGILLYSKKAEILPIERMVLFNYRLPKKKNHYLHFIRSLFGRKEKGYNDKGLLGQLNGKKLSSTVIIVPKENQKKLVEYLHKEKIDYSMKEICLFE